MTTNPIWFQTEALYPTASQQNKKKAQVRSLRDSIYSSGQRTASKRESDWKTTITTHMENVVYTSQMHRISNKNKWTFSQKLLSQKILLLIPKWERKVMAKDMPRRGWQLDGQPTSSHKPQWNSAHNRIKPSESWRKKNQYLPGISRPAKLYFKNKYVRNSTPWCWNCFKGLSFWLCQVTMHS